jgi:hypothetical protein
MVIFDMVQQVNYAGYNNTPVKTIELGQGSAWYTVVVRPYDKRVRLDKEERDS